MAHCNATGLKVAWVRERPTQGRMGEARDDMLGLYGTMEGQLKTNFCHRLFVVCVRYSECCMLVTCAKGPRFFCNGIDLNWLAAQDSPTQRQFLFLLNKILARFLTLPLVTVAALNGKIS